MEIRDTADDTPTPEAGGSSANEHRSPQSAEARLVAREAAGTWLAQVLNGGLRFVAAFFAARILGVTGFGTYTLALTVTGVGTVIAILGLSPGVLPFLSRARRNDRPGQVRALVRAALRLAAAASLTVGGLVFVSAPWVGETVFGKPELAGLLRSLSPVILFGALTAVLTTFLQGLLAVKERAWIEHVLVAGICAAGLAACWTLGWGWPGVVVATLAGPAVGVVCAGALLVRLSPGALQTPSPPESLPTRQLLAHSWPLLGTSMLVFLLAWSDILLLGVFRDTNEVGVYGLCARLVVVVLMFHESIGQVFLPRLSDLFVARDRDGMRRLYRLTSRWSLWPALAFAWTLMLWGRELLAVFGADFVRGAAPLAVLAAAKAVAACTGMSGRVFAVTGRARLNLINLLLMVTTNIVLNLVWIPRYGAMGAAVATGLSLTGIKLLQVVQVGAVFGLLPWDRRSLVPIGGISGLALAALPFREGLDGPFGWLAPLALFGSACVALFLVGGVAEDEREVWRALRSRLTGRTGP